MRKCLEVRVATLGPSVTEGVVLLWKELRLRGWTQGKLARELGMSSNAMVNRWLHAMRRPSIRWAVRIEQVTGVPVRSWSEERTKPFELRQTGS
jgi:transcriptional regulator with XRE-family HTH domain